MQVVETFGHYVEEFSNQNPAKGRWLLKTGWEAQDLKFRLCPDKRLLPADQYLAHMMMQAMLAPLKHPEDSSLSAFLPPVSLWQKPGCILTMWKDFPAI